MLEILKKRMVGEENIINIEKIRIKVRLFSLKEPLNGISFISMLDHSDVNKLSWWR